MPIIGYHQLVEHVALPMCDRLTHSKFWGLSKRVEQIRTRSHDYLTTLQSEQLAQLFDVAVEQTTFWPSRLSEAGPSGEPMQRLRALRPVSKTEIGEAFPDQIVNQSTPSADLLFAQHAERRSE